MLPGRRPRRLRLSAEAGSLDFSSSPRCDGTHASSASDAIDGCAGMVFVFGWNGHGQLGLGDCSERIAPRPLRTLAASGAVVKSIACGSNHSLVTDQHGCVWAWGDNEHGQLGVGDRRPRLEPARIQVDGQRVSLLACGAHHSLLCTSRGRVLSCGSHTRGQLGLKDDAERGAAGSRERLTNVVELAGSRVTAAVAGFSHSVFLTASGIVLSCGAGGSGQLGIGTAEDTRTPQAVASLTTAVRVIAAGNYHTCAVDEERTVYSWGEGRFGRLGHGTTASEFSPRPVMALQSLRVSSVACGGACTAAIDEEGTHAMLPTPCPPYPMPTLPLSHAPHARLPVHVGIVDVGPVRPGRCR